MSDDHDPTRKTPQEKKVLSYAKDRRNAYGQNNKASRKAIPARKSGENRKVRRNANQALSSVNRLDEESAELSESSLNHDVGRAGVWRKYPDVPLKEFLSVQEGRRVQRLWRRKAKPVPQG